MNLSDKLRIFRQMRGLTQKQLSEISGISLSAIKLYETNASKPRTEQMNKLCNSLGITKTAFYDTEVDTVGAVAALLFLIEDFVDIKLTGKQINGKYDPKTVSLKFDNPQLQEFIANWANIKDKIDIINKNTETIDTPDLKELAELQAEELYNKFKFTQIDSPIIVKRGTDGLMIKNYIPPSKTNEE